jgi:tetratricopeptide (TPR) repeat protein
MPKTTVRQQMKLWEKLEESDNHKFHLRFDKALAISQELLAKDPTFIFAADDIAENYLYMDRLAEAEKAALYSIKIGGGSCVSFYVLGKIYFLQQRYALSVYMYKKANMYFPNDLDILVRLSQGLILINKIDEAIGTLERCVHLNPYDAGVFYHLARAYERKGFYGKAVVRLAQASQYVEDDDLDLIVLINKLAQVLVAKTKAKKVKNK